MNIELANLSSLAPSVGVVEGVSVVSPVMTETGVPVEDFSSALVVQLELLNAIKAEDLVALQMPVQVALPKDVSAPTAGLLTDKADVPDSADLLGNNLPPSYKAQDNSGHEAALAAVTDTLKYMRAGTSAGEKAAKAEQNMQEVIAWAGLAQQAAERVVVSAAKTAEQTAVMAESTAKAAEAAVVMAVPVAKAVEAAAVVAAPVAKAVEAAAVVAAPVAKAVEAAAVVAAPVAKAVEAAAVVAAPVAKAVEAAAVVAAPVAKTVEAAAVVAAPVAKTVEAAAVVAAPVAKAVEAAAVVAAPVVKTAEPAVAKAPEQVISAKQNRINIAEQSTADTVGQDINSSVVMNAPAQMNLPRTNDKTDKKQSKDELPIAGVEDAPDTENVLPAAILPMAIPVESRAPANNVAHEDAAKENMPSFAKPSTNEAKPNVSAKTPDIALQSDAVSGLPVQDKQGFDLKYAAMTAQVEKAGGAESQPLVLDGEKSSSRLGEVNVAQFRSVDNKVDVPAITKPLSHPEWNKDLGERIVWMSSRAIPAAEIRLNPQHLGPVSVRVNVSDDQATVIFTAQNATTREAIEASIPKLREMMNAQQLNLVDVTVAHGSASDQGRSQAQQFAQTADRQGRNAAIDGGDGIDEVEQDIDSGRAEVSNGLLSLYA